MGSRYDHLNREELLRLLEARDRRYAETKFGLVWEADDIERERVRNADFVALDVAPELSCGSAPWRNLIIEGDNFDALRHLRMCFSGQVKCIYIDPPYNTGNRDFVYNDRFVDKEDSWRHSKWCEFMFQRLMIARDLLKQDGVIVVSIDDNEMATLRLLMNRVFGEGNFVATFVWKKVDSPNDNKVAITPDHEFIVCFALSASSVKFAQMSAPHIVEAYGSTDELGRRCRDRLLKKNGKNSLRKDRPTMFFPLTDPDGQEVFPIHDNGEEARWAMGRPGIAKHEAAGSLIWKRRSKQGKVGWEPYTREFAPDDPARPYPTIWSDLPTMRQAKALLRDIFHTADLFSTPKPIELIERILNLTCGPNDLVLDFFAGSGTTAHAVHKLNAEDGGRRRVILVSSTEATGDAPDKNLCRDVCATRVRRVIEGYTPAGGEPVPGLGGDFAYLRTRRIPAARLLEIDHAQVWTALQLMHGFALTSYVKGSFAWAGDEDEAVMFLPRFRREDLPSLRRQLKRSAAVALYSWQPSAVEQHLRAGHVTHLQIPETLARRFGLGQGGKR
ncbi:MAG TPA: site-specific DNA-methyltransferase [Opitutaceae bacterium]|nr:site-specific DNA-methyltransferase [Opitutaceae bacterium]